MSRVIDEWKQEWKWIEEDLLIPENKYMWSELRTEGVKNDQDKLRFDLIPSEALSELAEILTLGAKKYEARNWEKGMDWGRPFAACMRHMWAWWRGEDNDPETGKSHLSHALCNIVFLICYQKRNIGIDTRTK